MIPRRPANVRATWPSARTLRGLAAPSLVGATLALLVVLLPAASSAQARAASKAQPSVATLEPQVAALAAEIRGAREDLAAIRVEMGGLSSRLDEGNATGGAVKGIAEPMREEVRGLYVETSNVRSEIARLADTYAANTEALAKSRYVLTLLLVATVALQLIILAVLMRR